MRLLHIPPDPRAPDLTQSEAWRVYPTLQSTEERYSCLRGWVETLVARDLAPASWLDDEYLTRLFWLFSAALPILRNPRALINAEEILREGLAGTSGRYVGLYSWDTLCWTESIRKSGIYVPSAREFGLQRAKRVDLARDWLNATRDTGSSYGGGDEHAWYCARQILGVAHVAKLDQHGGNLVLFQDLEGR